MLHDLTVHVTSHKGACKHDIGAMQHGLPVQNTLQGWLFGYAAPVMCRARGIQVPLGKALCKVVSCLNKGECNVAQNMQYCILHVISL